MAARKPKAQSTIRREARRLWWLAQNPDPTDARIAQAMASALEWASGHPAYRGLVGSEAPALSNYLRSDLKRQGGQR